MHTIKNRLKRIGFIREHYPRLRKIALHLTHGRINEALSVANHYNPSHYFSFLTPNKYDDVIQDNLNEVLDSIFSLKENKPGLKNVGLVLRDGESFPKSSAFIRLIAPLTQPTFFSPGLFSLS